MYDDPTWLLPIPDGNISIWSFVANKEPTISFLYTTPESNVYSLISLLSNVLSTVSKTIQHDTSVYGPLSIIYLLSTYYQT